jgi:hypothetical protein
LEALPTKPKVKRNELPAHQSVPKPNKKTFLSAMFLMKHWKKPPMPREQPLEKLHGIIAP